MINLNQVLYLKTQKEKIAARLISMPNGGYYTPYPTVDNINRMIWFNGTVTKVFGSRVIEPWQIFVCLKCGCETSVRVDYTLDVFFDKPTKCSKVDCLSDRFVLKNSENMSKSLNLREENI